jgi:hypothetical protein
MNVGLHEHLANSYRKSKLLWEYKNICIISYPSEDHWMLIGILACHKTFFKYNPIMADKGQKANFNNALRVYVD